MVWNLLTHPIVRARFVDSTTVILSLPEVLEGLAADGVESFTALRPHQRHPWHALLCQLGAIACLRAGLDGPPSDATTWGDILAALTPEFPDGEPWWLVSPPDRPAFLQPVTGPLSSLKPVSAPDELDMLVTAKNHDLKVARMSDARPDDWLFALTSLQTFEGYLGAGNFGVSRMNGGFANRPGISVAPPGGVGAHVMRDIRRLIELFDKLLDRHDEYDADGLALLWLQPWDGSMTLPRKGLHPYYIENCRRVRLAEQDGAIRAFIGGSKVMRVTMTKEEGGITGDPWAPVRNEVEGQKVLTVDARGFDYRRLAEILAQQGYYPAPLQEFGDREGGQGWTLLCRALARGQGKTEGYHERRERIPPGAQLRMKRGEYDLLGSIAQRRIAEAGAVRAALRLGLMTLFQNGPARDAFSPRDPSSSRHAEPFLDRFQRLVDRDFVESLFEEFAAGQGDIASKLRVEWLSELRRRAHRILKAADAGSPRSAVRHHRALVRATAALDRGFYGAKELRDHFGEKRDVA